MQRSYYSEGIAGFLADDADRIIGVMAAALPFQLDDKQRGAWESEIEILQRELRRFGPAAAAADRIFLEFSIPRMGKRADAILVCGGVVFVIEFKVGKAAHQRPDMDQCVDYALDLKNFHEGSHAAHIVPVLVATGAAAAVAPAGGMPPAAPAADGVFDIVLCGAAGLGKAVAAVLEGPYSAGRPGIDGAAWEDTAYKPTPTIIEAARALYANHSVDEITHHEGGAKNLAETSAAVLAIIDRSKRLRRKSICFVTGVPGAGKTLAGLNIANARQDADRGEHAVFLSGNGPLVSVLQEALARDRVADRARPPIGIGKARREAATFIQNIHHFRDEYIKSGSAPHERVAIFDEAQRAWDRPHLSSWLARKKDVKGFDKSEPEFLIGVMDRHDGWASIVCLVGGGQEINTGEAGMPEWFRAVRDRYPEWDVYVSGEITDAEYAPGGGMAEMLGAVRAASVPDLHLSTSVRSFRSEHVSKFVKALLDIDVDAAVDLRSRLDRYPIVLTRDFGLAKQWLRDRARGSERFGIVAAAKSYRLQPHGIYVELTVDATKWFLKGRDDPRSSYSLEYAATEFDVQGLELDWACVAWDANLRRGGEGRDGWRHWEFKGAKWQHVRKGERQAYLKNAYRVLLTRARQGMVIFVPEGDCDDRTRAPEFYDQTYGYLRSLGLPELAGA